MFEVFVDAEFGYRFRLRSPDGVVLAVSGSFPDKAAAVAGMRAARECAGTALTADLSSRHGPAVPAAVPSAGWMINVTPVAGQDATPGGSLAEVAAEWAPDALMIIDGTGAIAYVNAAAETLFGYRLGRLLGRHYGTVIPDRSKGYLDGVRATFGLDGGLPQVGADLDFFGLRGDGTEFPMEVHCAPLPTTAGSGIVVSIRDATERKRHDIALREALSLVSSTLESTADGILVVTSNGKIAGSNERFASLWGIPADLLDSGDDGKLLGFVLDQLIDPDSFIAKVQELYADPDAESLDLLHFRDGRTFERYSRPQKLSGDVIGRVWSFRDISSRIQAEDQAQKAMADLARKSEELTILAFRDHLTGLANRALFRDRLEHALSTGNPAHIHVLLLDLDDFKEVNDVLGHQAGDEMLTEVGRRLGMCVAPEDTVGRLGGDEFVILLTSTSTSDADHVAARVVSALSAPLALQGHELHPSVSLGLTSADPAGAVHGPDLMRRADIAMYAAKKAGKNCYVRFHPDMMAELLARADLETGLRTAVEQGEITVHYQPVVNTTRAKVTQVEALVRWERPDRIMLPAEFIPAAESTGLINAIGQEVLAQTCTRLRPWLEQDPERCVAINVSPVQLRDPHYARTVLAALADARISGEQLVLEVTESVFLDTAPDTIAQLRDLRAHGVRVSLDDFGTGYSSLGRLQDLPVDILKIDQSFVAVIITGEEDLPILASMTVLAHELGLRITAEGVETPVQARRLLRLGCDCLQGYFFSRPVTLTDLPAAAQHAADRFLQITTVSPDTAPEPRH